MSSAYSFQDVQATLVGPSGQINLGYGAKLSEEGITTEMVGDKNSMTMGADGGGMHSMHASKAGVVTVRLLQTSPINAQLMAAYNEQSGDASLWGQNTIVVRNMKSEDIVTASDCAFKKRATLSYRQVGALLEWQFDCISIDTVLGVY